MNDDSPTLGSLMRALRARNGWTLKEMSDKTGIPRSTLAKVEHDRLTLGYDKLLQVSQRLKMRVSELLASGDETEGRMMTRRSIGTLDTAVRVDTRNYEYFFLCPDLRKKRMIPLFGRPRARTLEEFGPLLRHAGEEFIYVLTGRVEVYTEFYEPVILEPGQCMYIDSGMGHAYLMGPGCDDASVIAGCTSADDELVDSLTKSQVHAIPDAPGKPAEAGAAKQPRRAAQRAKHRRR